jgi:hypothetical protein
VVSTTAASAAAGEHLRMAAAATTATTAVALMSLLITLAAAAAVRPRTCRGCDRERGDAGCEKHPGHDKISFRTAKTARSLHRSNR